MNIRQKKLIDQLFDLAMDYDDNPHRAKLAAAITVRDRPIAWGFNSLKSHPFQSQFGKNEDAIFWHAETNAIHNALRRYSKEELNGSTLLIARAKKTWPGKKGKWVCGLAHPCEGCMEAIEKFKIKKVIYTTNTETCATLLM